MPCWNKWVNVVKITAHLLFFGERRLRDYRWASKIGGYQINTCLSFLTSLSKKAAAKLHGSKSGFLKVPRQSGGNFATSVQIVHHLQLMRMRFASSSPQWCHGALSMSNCTIIKQSPEYFPEFHSLLNSKNHLNCSNYQMNSSLP